MSIKSIKSAFNSLAEPICQQQKFSKKLLYTTKLVVVVAAALLFTVITVGTGPLVIFGLYKAFSKKSPDVAKPDAIVNQVIPQIRNNQSSTQNLNSKSSSGKQKGLPLPAGKQVADFLIPSFEWSDADKQLFIELTRKNSPCDPSRFHSEKDEQKFISNLAETTGAFLIGNEENPEIIENRKNLLVQLCNGTELNAQLELLESNSQLLDVKFLQAAVIQNIPYQLIQKIVTSGKCNTNDAATTFFTSMFRIITHSKDKNAHLNSYKVCCIFTKDVIIETSSISIVSDICNYILAKKELDNNDKLIALSLNTAIFKFYTEQLEKLNNDDISSIRKKIYLLNHLYLHIANLNNLLESLPKNTDEFILHMQNFLSHFIRLYLYINPSPSADQCTLWEILSKNPSCWSAINKENPAQGGNTLITELLRTVPSQLSSIEINLFLNSLSPLNAEIEIFIKTPYTESDLKTFIKEQTQIIENNLIQALEKLQKLTNQFIASGADNAESIRKEYAQAKNLVDDFLTKIPKLTEKKIKSKYTFRG